MHDKGCHGQADCCQKEKKGLYDSPKAPEKKPCCSSQQEVETHLPSQTSCCPASSHEHSEAGAHDAHHHHHHHRHGENHSHEDSKELCFGLLQGRDLVLYDASGQAKTFSYHSDVDDLCFDDHGGKVKSIPCLDEKGNYTAVACDTCGDSDPHIHAHRKEDCIDPSVHSEVLKVSNKTLSIPISENMPKVCNSSQLKNSSLRKRLHPVR